MKNNCQIPKSEENPKKFAQKRRKKEIEIERLQKQLEMSIPKGRDLTVEQWIETLAIATEKAPGDENEFKL